MPETTSVPAAATLKGDRRFRLFRKIISIPYLLALLGLLMPLMTVSSGLNVP